MKSSIFFISNSFNFDASVEDLVSSLSFAGTLIEKMESDKFISFFKSSDFYENAVNKIFGPNAIPESGLLSSLIYDGALNRAKCKSVDSSKILQLVNKEKPELDGNWISVFGDFPEPPKVNYENRKVNTEQDIINFSKGVVLENTYTCQEYSDVFEGIYRNLIFHPSYNDIENIDGGVENFISGILDMFDVMNSYVPTDGHTEQDIKFINGKIKFTTCEEGGGKKRRKNKESQLNFSFDIDGKIKSFNCEFHCKLEYFDNQYKKGKYHNNNRMYFGFNKGIKDNNKILIAHLGSHL
ncbi:hypothetical protein KIV40_24860 [Vibrio sp. D173a]|uniref:hypothetical protein n=1 Tax=Vibrio sp. D173a TaxID=2836349 RepID=UPI002554F90A|nr:hypothetical protein [Vibrio sp. D173a]MDK9758531.1 hypothetical protein [Vibrio sp. D173a]